MDLSTHNLSTLFAQLGLASDQTFVDNFIETHRPLPAEILLADAPFWSSAQSAFLREEILKDADWAEVVDQLNVRLHSHSST